VKTYGLRVLEDLCGGSEGCIARVLPWHELRQDGLWVKAAPRFAADIGGGEMIPVLSRASVGSPPAVVAYREAGVIPVGAELATLRWQPSSDGPALPIPFTARHLAAFWLAGGGLFLFERFDGGEEVDGAALYGLHDAVGELVREAHSLRTQARDKFFPLVVDEKRSYRDDERKADVIFYKNNDEGVQAAADWLLSTVNVVPRAEQSERESSAASEPSQEDLPTPLTTRQIALAFDGIAALSTEQWLNKLSDLNNAKWLLPAVVKRGRAPAPSTWNPCKLAEALRAEGATDLELRRLFLEIPELKPWRDLWQQSTRDRNAFGQ
jgi:hypothetical protein